MKLDFIGPTYQSRSPNIDAQRCINFYPEISPQDSKSVLALIGTPGTVLFTGVGAGPVRGMHVLNNVLYVVSGSELYSVDTLGGISASLGSLATNAGPVCMENNGLTALGVGGNEILITDSVNAYIYDVSTTVFTAGVAVGLSPRSCAYQDGYFIIDSINSMSYEVCDLYDGLTWNALTLTPVASASDKLQRVMSMWQQLWFVKEFSTEVWYNAGVPTSSGTPFARSPGAVLDYGTEAPFSVARGANTFFWLATQRTGSGGDFVGVVQVTGYVPTVISPPSINYQIAQLTRRSDAIAYCYSMEGHTFYVLTFPTDKRTFVFDATTQMWHERSTYAGSPYAIGRHIGNCYVSFNGKHYIGDYTNGNIYEMSSAIYDDNGQPIVSIRTGQHATDRDTYRNIFIKRLQIDIEAGVGLTGAVPTTGVDPQAILSWSDDGGHTWSNDYLSSMGKIGEYKKRLIWRRLGHSRDRIFRIAISDPVKKVIIGVVIE